MATRLSSPTQSMVAAATPSPPPITYVLSALTFSATTLLSLLKGISTLIITPIYHLLYRPLSYILAPAVLFVSIILDFFVWTPLAVIRYLAEQAYPIYLLVGVACILGVVIGVVTRGVAAGTTSVFMDATRVEVKTETREGMVLEPKRSPRRGSSQRRFA
ncbi:hypothetical protein OE88DRAFT_1644006 [Heliocybe sulcata]|uniref:Uncharacterized protein n=1 Tax=Heliocybe sulcata TaxID=5364 RepID=A0A5C3N737_9AGAM|nr:hypothetical protein OE88DRAFT_1644006 [Heliocybe sulcata]